MLEYADIVNFSFIEFIIAIFTVVFGASFAWFRFRKVTIREIGIFLQVALILVKMAKHYYDTHPESKKRLDGKARKYLQKIYKNHLETHDRGLRSEKDTGAAG